MELSSGLIPTILLAILGSAVGDQVCCPGLPNCFTDDAPYNHLPLPECQDGVEVSFMLFTSRNPTSGVRVDPDMNLPFVYDGSKRTAFIIHGWNSRGVAGWIEDLRVAFLGKLDMNVIQVDWQKGAGQAYYPQPVANIRTLGAVVGKLANKLIQNGGSAASRLWCLGASLGAHACGQAGKYVKFGRVTGFDPAGPLFADYDISTGLSTAAGDYVEAIHTAGRGGLAGINPGTLKVLGHVDFYPNAGDIQPGCDNYYAIQEAIQDGINSGDLTNAAQYGMVPMDDENPLACSHKRAQKYFIESLKSKNCRFYAKSKCTDKDDLPESCQDCGSRPCNELGLDSEQSSNHQGLRGLMYLETNGKTPFCRG